MTVTRWSTGGARALLKEIKPICAVCNKVVDDLSFGSRSFGSNFHDYMRVFTVRCHNAVEVMEVFSSDWSDWLDTGIERGVAFQINQAEKSFFKV